MVFRQPVFMSVVGPLVVKAFKPQPQVRHAFVPPTSWLKGHALQLHTSSRSSGVARSGSHWPLRESIWANVFVPLFLDLMLVFFYIPLGSSPLLSSVCRAGAAKLLFLLFGHNLGHRSRLRTVLCRRGFKWQSVACQCEVCGE